MDANIITLFKCLADKSRIQIIRSLFKEDMYVERLAERLGLSPPTISFHLKKLEVAGIVVARKEQYYVMYSLCKDVLSFNVMDALISYETDDSAENERDAAYRNGVLSAFIEYGKLKNIPAQRKKKNIIMEEIAKAFEIGKTYTEREVNIIIADFHDDFCTIRRELVELRLLIREDRVYRKVETKTNL